jgi:hypothetical protein
VIKLVLRVRDAADVQSVREAVGERVGIEVAGPDTPILDERTDVDTLAMEDWPAVERYVGRPPRTPGWVVLDITSGARVHVYEATVTKIGHQYLTRPPLATWIVAYSHFAPTKESAESHEAMVFTPGRAPRPITDEEAPYSTFLNTLEMMERHNISETETPIQRACIEVFHGWLSTWLPGLLRAYDTYWERALAGVYRP